MGCRFLDFDGEVFGDVSIECAIPKRHGVKHINLLGAFPRPVEISVDSRVMIVAAFFERSSPITLDSRLPS